MTVEKLDKRDEAMFIMRREGYQLVNWLSDQRNQERFLAQNREILLCYPLSRAMGGDRELLIQRLDDCGAGRTVPESLMTSTLPYYREWYNVANQAKNIWASSFTN